MIMPLHRRHVAVGNTNSPSSPLEDDVPSDMGKPDRVTPAVGKRRFSRVLVGLMVLEIIAQVWALSKAKSNKSTSYIVAVTISTFVSTLPMLMTIAVGLGVTSKQDLPHQRYIPLTVALNFG